MKFVFRKRCGRRITVAACGVAAAFVLFTHPGVSEDNPVYGPRFEIGGGLGYTTEQLPPRWAPKNNQVSVLTGSIRLFRGLAVQGGVDWSSGGKPLSDSISVGNYLVKINKGTFGGSRWAGVRYELPMSMLKQDIAGINSIYGAAGYTWSELGVQSTEWTNKGVPETADKERGFRLADMKGPYAVLAARWRINNPDPEVQETTWLGAYGLDFGVRYTRYREKIMADPGIPKGSDQFGSYQVFMVGFLKFRLFE